MSCSFSNFSGFFVCWSTNAGECRVQIKCKKRAQALYATLKTTMNVELFQMKNGALKKIA